MVRGSRLFFAALLAPALVACGGDDAEPQTPDPQCMATDMPPSRGAPIAGALQIGAGGPADFREYADGDSIPIVRGPQGGYMAIPVFRVDSTLLGTDGACASLNVIATVDALGPQDFTIKLPAQSPADSVWFFGSLPLFLASDESELVDRTVTYDAAFFDDGKEADAEVSLLLVESQ